MEPPFPERGTLLSIPYHTDRKRQGYICEFCMTNRIPQTRKMLHGRKIHAPPPVRTIDDYCTDGFHRVGRGLAPATGTGYDCALVRRSMDPDTARRHTQVPPYKHEHTTDKGRRAGPVCPAAGTRYRYPVYRWVPPCRAGACPRRWCRVRLRRHARKNGTGYCRDDVGIVPYIPERIADMECRAGPVCPAAVLHCRAPSA